MNNSRNSHPQRSLNCIPHKRKIYSEPVATKIQNLEPGILLTAANSTNNGSNSGDLYQLMMDDSDEMDLAMGDIELPAESRRSNSGTTTASTSSSSSANVSTSAASEAEPATRSTAAAAAAAVAAVAAAAAAAKSAIDDLAVAEAAASKVTPPRPEGQPQPIAAPIAVPPAARSSTLSQADLLAAQSLLSLNDEEDGDDVEEEWIFIIKSSSSKCAKSRIDRLMGTDANGWLRGIVRQMQVVRSKSGSHLLLTLRPADSTAAELRHCNCMLFGAWAATRLRLGDLVAIQGLWHDDDRAYHVTMSIGLIVVWPDELFSSTTVTGAMFCRRRAVLADRYPAVEEGASRIMFIGTMVHTLFQRAIEAGVPVASSPAAVSRLADEMCGSVEMMLALFEAQMSAAELRKEMATFVPRIVAFVTEFMVQTGGPSRSPGALGRRAIAHTSRRLSDRGAPFRFDGLIDQIVDIEENLWVPRLGMKGKIDATVQIRRRAPTTGRLEYDQVALEVKTGRASFSAEHTGQVNLYQMMMAETGRVTQGGLLLYLREGEIKEVHTTRNNERDLIMLRNELAHYAADKQSDISALPSVTSPKRKRSRRDTKTPPPREHPNEAAAGPSTSRSRSAQPPTTFAIPTVPQPSERFHNTFGVPSLPPPINHHSACAQCPYNGICTTLLLHEEEHLAEMSARHPLRSMLANPYLTERHVDYLLHWSGLITLEAMHSRRESNDTSTIWTDPPEVRAKRRTALVDLYVIGRPIASGDNRYGATFSHIFKPGQMAIDETHFAAFAAGDYVRISTRQRCAIAAGRVTAITANTIAVNLERDLSRVFPRERFILDRTESNASMMRTNAANLGQLMVDTEPMARFRRLIIDKCPPTFDEPSPRLLEEMSVEARVQFDQLNEGQKTGVVRGVGAKDYLLLRGLPGSGKTQTIAVLVMFLAEMGQRVLVTSHTHSAIDTVLTRVLRYGCEAVRSSYILRLGDDERIAPAIRPFGHRERTKECKTAEELRELYATYRIVGVTCLGANHPMIAQTQFDVCIVDEATQASQMTVLRPLFAARRFILIGDPQQLAPLVRSRRAAAMGADESLFERLAGPSRLGIETLRRQYRMNACITTLANKITYKNLLLCANINVRRACVRLSDAGKRCAPWVQRVLSTDLDRSCIMLDTGNVFDASDCIAAGTNSTMSSSASAVSSACNGTTDPGVAPAKVKRRLYANFCEAALVLTLTQALLQLNVAPESIGIMAPYTAQVEVLRGIMPDKGIEVNTIDQYQGRDKSVIILSCTKCDNQAMRESTDGTQPGRDSDILSDLRRMTVAVTRAKHKLIVIGDMDSLRCYEPFKLLFRALGASNTYKLCNLEQGFKWSIILSDVVKAQKESKLD